jgi:pyruvate carboxylase
MMAKSELRPDGQREVFCELNGQSRSILVRDKEASKVGDRFCFDFEIYFYCHVF